MSTYAAKTEVTADRSRSEIERTLERYGASHFGYMTEPGRAVIAFRKGNRQVRFIVPVRQRWRALSLVVKAKLEAVETGIASFEEEFYAYTLLPSGRTVFEETSEQVSSMIQTGMPGRLMLEADA